MEIAPKKGFQGLIENWQSDLVAALSVALIALPLSLGIALAAGAPPMAGIISAVVGGIVYYLVPGRAHFSKWPCQRSHRRHPRGDRNDGGWDGPDL